MKRVSRDNNNPSPSSAKLPKLDIQATINQQRYPDQYQHVITSCSQIITSTSKLSAPETKLFGNNDKILAIQPSSIFSHPPSGQSPLDLNTCDVRGTTHTFFTPTLSNSRRTAADTFRDSALGTNNKFEHYKNSYQQLQTGPSNIVYLNNLDSKNHNF